MDCSNYIEEIKPLIIEDTNEVINWMEHKRSSRINLFCAAIADKYISHLVFSSRKQFMFMLNILFTKFLLYFVYV